jgi:AraC-like DNA-binding protein
MPNGSILSALSYQKTGYFNVYRLKPFIGKMSRFRDLYNIRLSMGISHTLSISNPLINQSLYQENYICDGVFCVFDKQFIHLFPIVDDYEVFQPGGRHAFELNELQLAKAIFLYKTMYEELNSDYVFKYDILRTLVFELIHFALKMQPSFRTDKKQHNASQRISSLFLELLERQFPIDENHPKISLRFASDFAYHLAVHVNHLNRSVKETTQKTTTQIISERILQESKILLKHSTWNVSDIAYALGFSEVTHFNNFFKKHVQNSPLKFRTA